MASLVRDPLFETSGRGPSPNNNFYHFAVTKSGVIWRWWTISPRVVDRYAKPGEVKTSHQEFLDDTWMQSEVSMIFGRRILQYTKALCQGHYDYLEHLSDSLLLRIINYLELEDVGQLGRTSRRFRQLCGSEEFWEQAVQRRCNTVSEEVVSLALEVGWRSVFFTSKLQLQKLISRKRLKTEEEEQQEGQVSDPDTKAEESPGESTETPEISVSEEESQDGIISYLSLGTDTGSDISSCCDNDSDPSSEPEAGSNFSVPVPCQLFEDIKNSVVETPLQKSLLSNSRGDCRKEPDKTTS